MYEIIKITETNGRKAVSAKELYEKLGLNKAVWSRWYDKNIIKNPYAIENEDWVGFNIVLNGNETQDFALSLDFAKKLSMMARTEVGEKMRQYFIEVEKGAQAIARPISTLDMLELSIKQLRAQESRVDAIETKILEIEAKAATRPDYFTIVGYATLHKIQVGLKLASSLGKKASTICKAHNYPMEELPDPRFGRVRMYPAMVLQQVFEESLTHG